MWLTCHELFFKYIKMAYLDPHLHWQCITKCKDGGVAICGRNFILPYIVLVASPGGIKFLPQIATPPSFHSFKQRGGHHKKAIAKRMYSSLHLYCVQGPMWNWRRKFELIYNCGKYFGFTSTYKKYFPVTLSSKSQPSRNRLHEPFFSLSHSVVIDGLLRGLRMPGDGPCRGVSPWELSRDNHTTTSTTSCQLVLIKQNQCKIVWNKFFSFLFYVWNHPCSVQNWNLFHRQSSKELPSYFAGWPWKEPLLRNIWHKSQLGYFNCARHSFN